MMFGSRVGFTGSADLMVQLSNFQNPRWRLTVIYIIKCDMSLCLFVWLLSMAGRTAGPIKTKLGIGTYVDPVSVLVMVKVKVIWRHLVNANKTPYRGPQKPREFERNSLFRPEDGYLQLISDNISGHPIGLTLRPVCRTVARLPLRQLALLSSPAMRPVH